MLTLVPTPIGNLADITYRAVETLKTCHLIAVEDTRRTGILLKHYAIDTPMTSLHEHNEAFRSRQLVERILAENLHLALVSDAGMPCVSDPGYRLVTAAIAAGITVSVLPGACAAVTALAGSGLPTDSFYFAGFLPHRSGRRERLLREALARTETSIFYESPHRILKTLECLAALAPERPVCLARELTKTFEQYLRGTATGVLAHVQAHPPLGEICLLIAGEK